MKSEQSKPSFWRKITTIVEEIDKAFDLGSQDSAKIASLEKRIERLEALSPTTSRPE